MKDERVLITAAVPSSSLLADLKVFDLRRLGGFSGGTVVKNPPANAGDMGSNPGPGRSHMPRSN